MTCETNLQQSPLNAHKEVHANKEKDNVIVLRKINFPQTFLQNECCNCSCTEVVCYFQNLPKLTWYASSTKISLESNKRLKRKGTEVLSNSYPSLYSSVQKYGTTSICLTPQPRYVSLTHYVSHPTVSLIHYVSLPQYVSLTKYVTPTQISLPNPLCLLTPICFPNPICLTNSKISP